MLLEFRVPLPYCVENPTIGYLFMNMEACKSATGGGEGVEWLVEEEYRSIRVCHSLATITPMVIWNATFLDIPLPRTRERTPSKRNGCSPW